MANLTTTWQLIGSVSTRASATYWADYTHRLYARYSNKNDSALTATVEIELRQVLVNGNSNAFYYNYNRAYNLSSKSATEGSYTTRYSNTLMQGTVTRTESVLFSTSWTQSYASDGSCSVDINYNGYCYFDYKEMSVNVVLPTIAVTPTLSVNSLGTMSTSGASVGYTLGSTGGRSTAFQYSTNNSTWTTLESRSANGTYSATLPNLISSYTNTTSPTVYFRVTNSGGTSGSTSKSTTIDSSIVPTLGSISVTGDNGDYSTLSGLFVQNITKPSVAFNNAAGTYGSSVNTYVISGGLSARTSGTTPIVYPSAIPNNGTISVVGYVKDTRGRTSATNSASISVIEYYNPSLVSVSIIRCNQDGTENNKGAYAKLTTEYKIAPITSSGTDYNTKLLQYSLDGETWTTITTSNWNASVDTVIGGSFSTSSSYKVYIKLTDLTSIVNQEITLPTSAVTISKHEGGNGITFGQVAEEDGFHNYWETNLHGTLNMVVDGVVVPILEIVDE